MSNAHATRVEIYDQSYAIGGENNAEYVRRLAERVDAKMRQVARETRVVDSVRVAVLAAINLADENETLRARAERSEQQIRALSRELDGVLDRAV
jgi:cell division protein ZapA